MKYLLDTCVLLWALTGDEKRLKEFISPIQDIQNSIFVSIVSYWEIVVKKTLNKITIPDNFIELVEKSGFSWLQLELHHIQKLEKLPLHHNDPFDRLLVAQAMANNFQLLTPDKHILEYFKSN
ncbi:PIN domain (plasmid) [Legionella adelaidensis]|uniref:PIN domain n=1 Tax=Legionella adelaidensis TaxID=45056 RepID=A0A0W0R2K6_9GAMM|nr:type II toxin-antitoxin system VapC family toxin [Legionella adelaidensis]KTC65327.1 PIN domain protein [Legionella adelaidensis]VEH86022.1 PIN domain [Legionella adelaidensis]